ncbi:MAG: ATP-binding protein [Lachnospiraceae bacterium]|nr:ATP-binding protein [Lachnospiraceae bacterium]
MICQFTFENYKVFKQEATLDFIAEPIREHGESLILDVHGREKLIPVISIYGPNGGGKSTVLEALVFLRNVVLQAVLLMSPEKYKEGAEEVFSKPYLSAMHEVFYKFSAQGREMPTRFDIMFDADGCRFRYQLAVREHRIVEENLYYQKAGTGNVQLVFERSAEECVLGEEVEEVAVGKVSDTMPLLSHIAMNYDIETVDVVIQWFFSIALLDYNNSKREKRIAMPNDADLRKRLFGMLEEMDIPIHEIRIEKDLDGNVRGVFTEHRTEDGGTCELRLEDESSGTKKLLSCLARIMACLGEGTLMIADELDAKLHPKLLQYIIQLFTNPESNKNGAQLLLTSHDITTLNHDMFRRDEIWFCAKNPFGASMLYSLASFRKEDGTMIRSDEVYGKRYLEGRYGADPYIRKILNWGQEENESKAEKGQ